MASSPTNHASATVSGAAHAPATHAAVAPATITPEERAAGSIGAQVILDFNSDSGKAARGAMSGEMQGNVDARDTHLISIGLDPNDVSGPPTGEPWVPPTTQRNVPAPAASPVPSGMATHYSSLAAGIQNVPSPPPAGSVMGALGGAAHPAPTGAAHR